MPSSEKFHAQTIFPVPPYHSPANPSPDKALRANTTFFPLHAKTAFVQKKYVFSHKVLFMCKITPIFAPGIFIF